jgi:hypothetical protein
MLVANLRGNYGKRGRGGNGKLRAKHGKLGEFGNKSRVCLIKSLISGLEQKSKESLKAEGLAMAWVFELDRLFSKTLPLVEGPIKPGGASSVSNLSVLLRTPEELKC